MRMNKSLSLIIISLALCLCSCQKKSEGTAQVAEDAKPSATEAVLPEATDGNVENDKTTEAVKDDASYHINDDGKITNYPNHDEFAKAITDIHCKEKYEEIEKTHTCTVNHNCMFANKAIGCEIVKCKDRFDHHEPELEKHGYKVGDYLWEVTYNYKVGADMHDDSRTECFYTEEAFKKEIGDKKCTRVNEDNKGKSCIFDDENDDSEKCGDCDKTKLNEEAPKQFGIKIIETMNWIDKFGKKNEAKILNPNIKFADIEGSLPVPLIKASTDEEALKKLESMKQLNCIFDSGKSVESIVLNVILCIPQSEEFDEECNDDNNTTCEFTADAYLSLKNSRQDKQSRIYLIKEKVETSNIEDNNKGIYINDALVRSFMDTQALYVRFLEYSKNWHDGAGADTSIDEKKYTTYVFAGKKMRLVHSWEDASISQVDILNNGRESSSLSYTEVKASFDGKEWSYDKTENSIEE